MGTIPKNYDLEPSVDRKAILKRSYKNWTVGDLKEFLSELPDNATVWITRYDEDLDDILIRPLESFASSHDGKTGYVTL